MPSYYQARSRSRSKVDGGWAGAGCRHSRYCWVIIIMIMVVIMMVTMMAIMMVMATPIMIVITMVMATTMILFPPFPFDYHY